MSLIEVKSLSKRFEGKRKKVALDSVSFSVEAGEVFGVLGPNGAGKTTLLRILTTALTPTSGNVTIFGKDLGLHRSEILQQVGFASSYSSLPLFLTVEENLKVHGALYGLDRRTLQTRSGELLEFFGAAGLVKQRFGQLSAGQATRVLLVKAFLSEPKLVLLDEPTASLDPDIAKRVREFLEYQHANSQVSMIITSHNMQDIEYLCRRLMFLREGRVHSIGSIQELVETTSDTTVMEFQLSESSDTLLTYFDQARIAWEKTFQGLRLRLDEKQVYSVLQYLSEQGVPYSRLSVKAPSLEDYFVATGEAGNAAA